MHQNQEKTKAIRDVRKENSDANEILEDIEPHFELKKKTNY